MDNTIGVIVWFIVVIALIWGFGGFVAYIEYQEQSKKRNRVIKEKRKWQI